MGLFSNNQYGIEARPNQVTGLIKGIPTQASRGTVKERRSKPEVSEAISVHWILKNHPHKMEEEVKNKTLRHVPD